MKVYYKQIAGLYKSLADENRLKIIFNLAEGKKSVSKIVEETGFSQPLVSHHLKELKHNHIVTTEREGSFVFYQLTEPAIVALINLTNQLVIELSEKGNIFSPPASSPEFPFSAMMEKMMSIFSNLAGEK